MKIEQRKFTPENGWRTIRSSGILTKSHQLILVFGSRALLADASHFEFIHKVYPKAAIILCSTAGEICDTEVNDNSISCTAIHFEKIKIKTAGINISDHKNSLEAGTKLAAKLDSSELKNVLIISDGQKVNGSDLVEGLQKRLPKDVILTGGLAGDGTSFQTTLVGLNEVPIEGRIVAIGFYGNDFSVTYGSAGGWDPFGVERLITKSRENILYELDGKPALDIYKLYLGEYASELPSAGLLFPLSIRPGDGDAPVVRTILSVNEANKSLTFAGNMPEGAYAQLMKANLDRLVDGACDAAVNATVNGNTQPELAILISCVGRKLVLGQRIEEEVEIIRDTYGEKTAIAGFYSYGEISPSINSLKCDLHNQTMTITTITEQ